MPARQEPAAPGTSVAHLSLPDDVRADLLKAQADSLIGPVELVKLKIMGSGACQFEFEDDPGVAIARVKAIILHAHPTNVLWTRKMGEGTPNEDPKERLPRCSSNDGKYGIPVEGFAHAGLPQGVVGDGETLKVACETCPYNQFGSGAAFISDRNPRGKAVTNQRKLFLMVEGRDAPVVLTLPAMSVVPYDEYSSGLLNRGIPVQAVVTEFSQVRKGAGAAPYGVVIPKTIADLDPETFNIAMDKRKRYHATLFENVIPEGQYEEVSSVTSANDEEEDEVPF